jgi:hypothetical protein
MLAVLQYGCASRTNLGPLATPGIRFTAIDLVRALGSTPTDNRGFFQVSSTIVP